MTLPSALLLRRPGLQVLSDALRVLVVAQTDLYAVLGTHDEGGCIRAAWTFQTRTTVAQAYAGLLAVGACAYPCPTPRPGPVPAPPLRP